MSIALELFYVTSYTSKCLLSIMLHVPPESIIKSTLYPSTLIFMSVFSLVVFYINWLSLLLLLDSASKIALAVSLCDGVSLVSLFLKHTVAKWLGLRQKLQVLPLAGQSFDPWICPLHLNPKPIAQSSNVHNAIFHMSKKVSKYYPAIL